LRRAQQPAMPVVGFLNGASPGTFADNVTAFRLGLKDSGLLEGQNVAIEYRWADGVYDRLPELAADLVRRRVAVVAATGGAGESDAVRLAAPKTPFVFLTALDPVKRGLVASLNRPGGNVTGVNFLISALDLSSRRWTKRSGVGFLTSTIRGRFQMFPRALRLQLRSIYLGRGQETILKGFAMSETPLRMAFNCRAFLYGFPPHLGHGHLNATGSEVSGRSIGNWLCQSHPQRN
jgi:hypothetical protein